MSDGKHTEHSNEQTVRLTAWVHGLVQGVGFRWWTRCQASELGLAGSATNYPDGRVLVIAQGSQSACDELLEKLKEKPSQSGRPGEVDLVVDSFDSVTEQLQGFQTR